MCQQQPSLPSQKPSTKPSGNPDKILIIHRFLLTHLIYCIVVALLCSHKLDLSIGCPWSHAAVSDLVLEQKWESFPEGLLEGGAHEAINYGINRRVGVRHAVGPRLDLVGCVVELIVCRERLKEDKDLDGTPADGEEEDDYDHHLWDFAPDANGSFREKINLYGRTVSLISSANYWNTRLLRCT